MGNKKKEEINKQRKEAYGGDTGMGQHPGGIRVGQ